MANSPLAAQAARSSRVPSQTRPSLPDAASPARPAVPSFSVDISALRADGSRVVAQHSVPAVPLMVSAFAAFGRGTLLRAEYGETAVEDLEPGDMLWTGAGTPGRVMWIGSSTFRPVRNGPQTRMVRVMPDSFGLGRPASFLTLGPAARILHAPADLRSRIGATQVLTPVSEFVDHVNVIEVMPPTPLQMFHIVLERHAVISAGGLECETFHPGGQAIRQAGHMVRDQFLALFPHMTHVTEFGPLAHPRAPEQPTAA